VSLKLPIQPRSNEADYPCGSTRRRIDVEPPSDRKKVKWCLDATLLSPLHPGLGEYYIAISSSRFVNRAPFNFHTSVILRVPFWDYLRVCFSNPDVNTSKMAWGVLEDRRTPKPAGTVLLDDVIQQMKNLTNAGDSPELAHLKRDAKNKHIILQPQPSDSVNDPLNWSTRTKVTIVITLIATMTAVGGILGMLGTAGRILATKYHVDYPTIVKTLSPPAIAANAISLFVACSISAVYGKRLQIFIGVMVIWINMLAGYYANSLGYYRNLAIVNGVFGAPLELLIAPIITDMVFIHERGRLMALTAVIGVIGGDAR
jgi:hypothetical protein